MTRYFCALFASLALLTAGHAAERRVALVIGNSAYKQAPLINPGNDARAVARALRDSGFTVTELRNLNQAGMRRAIRRFGDEIAKGGAGLFFYAGHGMQIRGRNFLIPVGSDIQREDEVEDQAVDARLVLEKMASAKNPLNIVILDACRNNPFISGFRSTTVGLAAMDAPAGTLVAFSTAPGQVAADGTGDNGLYTKHLVSYMREPGLKVEDVFKRVRAAVRQESGGAQTPWENTSLELDFYFRPLDPRVVEEQNREREQAQKAAIDKAVQEALQRNRDQAAQERAAVERQIAERVAAERAAAERAAAERIAAMEKKLEDALGRVPAPAAAAPLAGPAMSPATIAKRPQATATAPVQSDVKLASAAPTTRAIPSAAAPALPSVGDTWTYWVKERDYGKVTERHAAAAVTAVTDSEIHVGGVTRITARYDHQGNLLYNVGRDNIERKYDPFVPLFSFPLEPGRSWQGKYRMTRSDGRSWDYDMSVTVVGWEDVTVPAGPFKALKLSSTNWYRRTDPGGTGSGKIVLSRWYVPEVKRFVKSETLEVGSNNVVYQDNTWELTAYSIR